MFKEIICEDTYASAGILVYQKMTSRYFDQDKIQRCLKNITQDDLNNFAYLFSN